MQIKMYGSKKQIDWATSLRDENLKSIKNYMAGMIIGMAKAGADAEVKKVQSALDVLEKNISNASWWIENQDYFPAKTESPEDVIEWQKQKDRRFLSGRYLIKSLS